MTDPNYYRNEIVKEMIKAVKRTDKHTKDLKDTLTGKKKLGVTPTAISSYAATSTVITQLSNFLSNINWNNDFNKILDFIIEDFTNCNMKCKKAFIFDPEALENTGVPLFNAKPILLNVDQFTIAFSFDDYPLGIYFDGKEIVKFKLDETEDESTGIGEINTMDELKEYLQKNKTPMNKFILHMLNMPDEDTKAIGEKILSSGNKEAFTIVLDEVRRKIHPNLVDLSLQVFAKMISEIDYMHLRRTQLLMVLKESFSNCNIEINPSESSVSFATIVLTVTSIPGNDCISEERPLRIHFTSLLGSDKMVPTVMRWCGIPVIAYDTDAIVGTAMATGKNNECHHIMSETGESALQVMDDGNVECLLCKQVWTK